MAYNNSIINYLNKTLISIEISDKNIRKRKIKCNIVRCFHLMKNQRYSWKPGIIINLINKRGGA